MDAIEADRQDNQAGKTDGFREKVHLLLFWINGVSTEMVRA